MLSKCIEVIEDIKSGNLTLPELQGKPITKFIPIVLTLQPFPNMPYIWTGIKSLKGIDQMLKEKGLLEFPDVQPLTMITVEEVEILVK